MQAWKQSHLVRLEGLCISKEDLAFLSEKSDDNDVVPSCASIDLAVVSTTDEIIKKMIDSARTE